MPIALPFDDDLPADSAAPPPDLFVFDSDVLPSGRTARIQSWTSGVLHKFQLAQQGRGLLAAMHATDALVRASIVALDGKPPSEADVQNLHDADAAAVLLRARWQTFAQPDDRRRVVIGWFCAPPFIDKRLACDPAAERLMRMQVPFDPVGAAMEAMRAAAEEVRAKALAEARTQAIAVTPAAKPERITLRLSGKVATYAPPTRATAYAYRELMERAKTEALLDPWRLALAREVHLDGVRATEDMLAALPPEDSAEIGGRLLLRGGPETVVKALCSNCGALYATSLESTAGFFGSVPTRRRSGR